MIQVPPLFFDILIGGISLGALYALVALGLNLQYGVTRAVNIAHGEFLMLGAYITFYLSTLFGIDPFFSLVINGFVAFIFGYLIYIGILGRLLRLSKSIGEFENKSLLICFGLQFIIQNIAVVLWTANYTGPLLYASEPVNIGGVVFPLNRILVAAISLCVNLILYIFLHSTNMGLCMRAAIDDSVGAQLVGIDVSRYYSFSFAFGLVLSAWTGSLLSLLYVITPFIGSPYTFIALIVIVLGGVGSLKGSLIGGMILGFASYVTMRLIHSSLTLVVLYAILVIMLLVRPKGLFRR
ncbi:MAG: branched-chain amino acid ABC transporter permease [Candidatus Bathyarchaeia archaeon]